MDETMLSFRTPDNRVRFEKSINGDLLVYVPFGGDDPNLSYVYRIEKEQTQKLAEYLREVE